MALCGTGLLVNFHEDFRTLPFSYTQLGIKALDAIGHMHLLQRLKFSRSSYLGSWNMKLLSPGLLDSKIYVNNKQRTILILANTYSTSRNSSVLDHL